MANPQMTSSTLICDLPSVSNAAKMASRAASERGATSPAKVAATRSLKPSWLIENSMSLSVYCLSSFFAASILSGGCVCTALVPSELERLLGEELVGEMRVAVGEAPGRNVGECAPVAGELRGGCRVERSGAKRLARLVVVEENAWRT